jgi:four helix bundle protein
LRKGEVEVGDRLPLKNIRITFISILIRKKSISLVYKDFTETDFWKKAIRIDTKVFFMTNDLPRKEDYGLTSQLRRAAVSISANIAEAFGRNSGADKSKFYDYARGSAFETKSLLLYGVTVKYFVESEVMELITSIDQTIHDINKVKKSLRK